MNRTRLDLLTTLPRGVGAELGVFRGDFAAHILARVQPTRLWLVDTFTGLVTSGDQDGNYPARINMADQLAAVRARFAAYRQVEVVQSLSHAWLAGRAPGSLDWVYIDTDHTYATTAAELAAARTAVRAEGIIAGHDYAPAYPGVIRAVNEFAEAHSLVVDVWDGDSLPSYRIQNG